MGRQLVSSLLVLITLGGARGACDGVTVSGVYHDKEVLKSGLDRPYQMVADYCTKMLYFSEGDESNSTTAQLNLETKEYEVIENLPNGFSLAVDQSTRDIYIGGVEGLVKYNPITKEVDLIAEQNNFVLSVYFKDILYYSTFESINTVARDQPKPLDNFENRIAFRFVVDDEDDVIFFNWGSLYRQKLGTKDAIVFKNSNNLRALGTDIYGRAYVCRSDGIYGLDKRSNSLFKLVDVAEPLGVAFDRDNNMIYADYWTLYRLRPNPGRCC